MRDHQFKNEGLFYRFINNVRDHGYNEEGRSWNEMIEQNDQKVIKDERVSGIDILIDEFNCQMLDNIRPIKWVDP